MWAVLWAELIPCAACYSKGAQLACSNGRTCCCCSDGGGSLSSREAEWITDLEDEVWVMREEFSSELPDRQAVYQQELQAWKEGDRRRVSKPGREEGL